ncbi:hypothetical protein BN2127_JRS3_00484 [Bacillus safensis]|uniref:hypothetical protein n=1 Tax=Bacillus safensis TaxID=561879 RepID=UPI0006A83B81|nr:hypothetical protein [Bacillus safensis]CUB15728.1 hypothetical protein BN2127_JRS3_00484 [Bacillus safensis]
MQNTYDFYTCQGMINFAWSYIHEKGFTFIEYVTLTGVNDPGQKMKISFNESYNNVTSLFVLKFGTEDEIKEQLDLKMTELYEIRDAVVELKRLLGA